MFKMHFSGHNEICEGTKSFGGTWLTAVCYWPWNHCILAQRFVPISGELSHNHSQWVLDSDKGVYCHDSFS